MPHNEDFLTPPFDDPKRKSTLVVATFNLSASIVGGGVLSLPLAFSRCGIILGTVLMAAAAVATDRSMYLLCLCARRFMTRGSTSYGEVGREAFGRSMEISISLMIHLVLIFAMLAYTILLGDIVPSLIEEATGIRATRHKHLVIFFILVLVSPFMVQRSLYALRYNCYVGYASISVLALALCQQAWANYEGVASDFVPLFWTDSIDDVLFSFPIITLSFLGIFNILPIQGALLRPSKLRTNTVISGSLTSCFLLNQCLGLAGYLYAQSETNGNILVNCVRGKSWAFFIGRIGCSITLIFALAIIMLPCRSTLLEAIEMIFLYRENDNLECVENESTSLIPSGGASSEDGKAAASEPVVAPVSYHHSLAENETVHFVSTFGIVIIIYVASMKIPEVAAVWQLCGSFMAFLVAFTIPSACYIKLSKRQEAKSDRDPWLWFSWITSILSIFFAIACTAYTFATVL